MTKWYYCEKVNFIWQGTQSDYLLEYEGKVVNGNAIENSICNDFKCYCEELGKEVKEEEEEQLFYQYCLDNEHFILELIALSEEEENI